MIEKEKTRDSLDFKAALKTAEMDGVKKVAKKMKEKDFSFALIAQVTGLSISEIENF